MSSRFKRYLCISLLIFSFAFLCCSAKPPVISYAVGNNSRITDNGNDVTGDGDFNIANDPNDNFNLNITSDLGSVNLEATLKILLLLTILALAPSILIMVTSFVRVVVVLHFLRTALGTQTTPPNQVIIALALFITFAVMSPVFNEINTTAVQPYEAGQLSQKEAIDAGVKPLRTFMLAQTRDKDLKMFMDIKTKSMRDMGKEGGASSDAFGSSSSENSTSSDGTYKSLDEIPITTIIPAFMISELRTAFIIGFLIYLPFIVVDMVVSSTLMSMGMMMLPPTTISLPFKLLLFVLADGWNLVIGQLVNSFN
ncbi:MAG: flagellar type III secretion system pore protein FliP [Lachnospiraceae bacterium]|jgi:flagellar biosynthetic protein FliP|nr:flagellar type III secretion system pore protein FliP [Lachnospiraceae bacterium]MEE3460442.1 flagellar type III secretion system pore protein FliP [Lachnospiraceae bacterium]